MASCQKDKLHQNTCDISSHGYVCYRVSFVHLLKGNNNYADESARDVQFGIYQILLVL